MMFLKKWRKKKRTKTSSNYLKKPHLAWGFFVLDIINYIEEKHTGCTPGGVTRFIMKKYL